MKVGILNGIRVIPNTCSGSLRQMAGCPAHQWASAARVTSGGICCSSTGCASGGAYRRRDSATQPGAASSAGSPDCSQDSDTSWSRRRQSSAGQSTRRHARRLRRTGTRRSVRCRRLHRQRHWPPSGGSAGFGVDSYRNRQSNAIGSRVDVHRRPAKKTDERHADRVSEFGGQARRRRHRG